jgi:antitoxin (DNA-binding transcriptional repressor) of toxin-antitoxin stability system
MIKATMSEAKTRLSKFVSLARQGQRVVITNGRERVPVAEIIALEPQRQRTLGVCYRADFQMPADFFDPLTEQDLKPWNGLPPTPTVTT